MLLKRKLLLALFTASSLLCVYIIYGNLERPLSWSIEPLRHLQVFTQGENRGSRDSEEPLDRQSSSDQWTPPAPTTTFNPQLSDQHEHTRAEHTPTTPTSKTETFKDNLLNVSKSSSRSVHGLDKTRTSTEAPTVKPQPPKQAAGPTEPPFIGDTYMSEDIPPQSDCPDGIRSRVTKTEFGERFLKNIPVLQWAQHVTPEQHQRLSKYTGAHGWSMIDYKTLVETLSVLNSSANSRLLDDWKDRSNKSECIHCAVVGNGGILKDSQKGKEIDSHHYVFRTNGAIIKGFEQDVGSRTTHYTFSSNTLRNSLASYKGAGYEGPPLSKETRYVFLPDHDRDYLMMKAAATHTVVERGSDRGKDPSQYFGKDVSAEKLKMYHPDFIRYARNRFLRSTVLKGRFKNIYRPSTGAVMLLAALHTCDKVSAYGFMTADYNKYSNHYYDKSYQRVGFYANHDLQLEMVLWQQLDKAGLLRLYVHK